MDVAGFRERDWCWNCYDCGGEDTDENESIEKE